jgi:hypothetical protein
MPGLMRLVKRLAAREDPDMDVFTKRKFFSDALSSVISCDNFEVAKWLVEEYLPCGRIRGELEEVAARGQARIIRWLWEHHRSRVVWTFKLVYCAGSRGNIELAKWLYAEIGLENPGAKQRIEAAATNSGNIVLLGWAIEIGAPFHVLVICDAIKFGRVSILQWATSVQYVRRMQLTLAGPAEPVRAARDGL